MNASGPLAIPAILYQVSAYHISPIDDTDAVCIKVQGDVNYETAAAIQLELAPDRRFLHSRRLLDLRGCRLLLTPEELRAFAKMAIEYDHEPARVAVLIDSDIEFGLMRLHSVYRESKFTRLHICRDEAEAMSWLLAEPGD